jgi:site-specific DNA-methyltransferase (adenine-specific)
MTEIGNGTFYHGDCFEVMRSLPDGCVDMVLCDLPYGTTQNKWDSVLPLDALWKEYWRLCRGAVVLTAAQPFTSALVMSQIERFKYDWVWRKNRATGVLNAKKQPLRNKEDVLIFSKGAASYFPQGLVSKVEKSRNGKMEVSQNYRDGFHKEYVREWGNYPKQVLDFDVVQKTIHPTQKPVALFEYLIRTYTNPGDTVLDNTAGSGTTAIAAENCGRKWICIERDDAYYAKAVERVQQHISNRPML